jgi:uroporphyrinogen-III synthase
MIKILSTKTLSPTHIQIFEENGFDIKDMQFIDFQYLTPNILFNNKNKYAIFTSQNGVIGFEKIYKGESDLNIFCLEGPTAYMAEKWGKIQGTAANSVALAEQILESDIEAVAYFKGNLSRPDLAGILRGQGVKVSEYDVYKTILTPFEVASQFDAYLFFSPSAVDSFFKKNIINTDIPCFCIGHTTATTLQRYNHQAIYTPTTPSVSGVVDCVLIYFKNIKQNV